MAKKRLRRGVTIWTTSSHPDTLWLELGKRNAEHYYNLDVVGMVFLAKIPAPYSAIALAVAGANRSEIKRKTTSRGVWVKFSVLQPFVKARKRTKKNMQKRPKPW